MDEEIITPETLSDGADVTPSGGKGTDSEIVSFREVLNAELGKNFPTDEAALKATKDTFSFVGKIGKAREALDAIKTAKGLDEEGALKYMEELAKQPVSPQQDQSGFAKKEEVEALKQDLWFKDHQELLAHRDVLSQLSKSQGKSLDEVIKDEGVKTLLEKAAAYEQSEKSKSVLQSNPRIGAATDKMSQAQEAQKNGDTQGARAAAVEAVMSAYDLKK